MSNVSQPMQGVRYICLFQCARVPCSVSLILVVAGGVSEADLLTHEIDVLNALKYHLTVYHPFR